MKIILVATPRSGSMSIYNSLFKRYSNENTEKFFEIFNPRSHGPSSLKGIDLQAPHFILRQHELWKDTDSSISKIDPYHIFRRSSKKQANIILDDMLTSCDKLFYCYRRNTTEQINSLALAKKTKEWRRDNRKTNADITEDEFKWCGETLIFRYEQQIDLLERYPGEVLCMEDVLNYDPYKARPKIIYEYDGPNIEQMILNSSK